MKINEFDKMQRRNIVFAIIGGVIGIWGLTNHAFNKGTLNGASVILEKVSKIDKDVYTELTEETEN